MSIEYFIQTTYFSPYNILSRGKDSLEMKNPFEEYPQVAQAQAVSDEVCIRIFTIGFRRYKYWKVLKKMSYLASKVYCLLSVCYFVLI